MCGGGDGARRRVSGMSGDHDAVGANGSEGLSVSRAVSPQTTSGCSQRWRTATLAEQRQLFAHRVGDVASDMGY